jgi:hypothetical protein
MALRKNLTETPVAETPVAETPVAETPVAETPVAETPVAETSVVVTRPKPSVQGTVPAPPLLSLRHEGAPIHAVEATIKIDGMDIVEKVSKLNFGSWLDIQVIATYPRYQVQPDCQMGHPNNKYYRESYDKLTIASDGDEGGLLITEYMSELEDVCEFKKQLGHRLDIYAILLGADKPEAAKKAEGQWTIVRIDMSKAGIPSYAGLETTSNIAIARGTLPIDKQNCVRLSAAKKQGKTTSYTHLNAGLIPVDTLENYTVIPMPF